MRVISGIAKGRRLLTPKGQRVRPTADRVKEALFSILISRSGTFEGYRILDIFAGTGNLGIEALSRGAEEAVFIDNQQASIALIKKNLLLTGFCDKSRVLTGDARSVLTSLNSCENPFQVIFLDPPYQQGLAEVIMDYLSTSRLIDTGSEIVVECSGRERLPEIFGRVTCIDKRIYGDSAIYFYSSA